MGGADDGDRTGRGRLGEGPVTGEARTMTRLRPRGPVTRLSPNARRAAELRELGSSHTRNSTERARGNFAEGSRGHDQRNEVRTRTHETERLGLGRAGDSL